QIHWRDRRAPRCVLSLGATLRQSGWPITGDEILFARERNALAHKNALATLPWWVFGPALVLTPIRIAIVARAGVAALASSVRARRGGRPAQRYLKRIGSEPVVTLRTLQAPPDDQDDHTDERDQRWQPPPAA